MRPGETAADAISRTFAEGATAALPQSADTLEDSRALALKIIREFGAFGHGYHAGVMLTMRRWLDGGMDGPVPWPESPTFDTWAAAQGMSNIDGSVGYRLTMKLEPDALRALAAENDDD